MTVRPPSCPWCGHVIGSSGHTCRKAPTAVDLRPGDPVAGVAACRAALAAATKQPAPEFTQGTLDLEEDSATT